MSGTPERGQAHVLEVRHSPRSDLWFPVVDGVSGLYCGGFETPEDAWRFARAVAALDKTDGTYSLPRQEVKR